MKLKIDNDALAEEFFEDSLLLGIMAPVKDYQFSWHLNQLLGLDFRLNNDLEIKLTKKDRHYFFAVYEYQVPGLFLNHYLYSNKFDGEFLLPEFKHLDFLWLIKGDVPNSEELQALMQAIRTVHSVQLVIEMTNEKIKNKQHLIF
jgi:hypothetical protein